MRLYKTMILTFLLFILFGVNLALASNSAKQVTSVTIDKTVERFVQSKQNAVSQTISESKKNLIKSMIASINQMCGNFVSDTSILKSAECTTTINGKNVTFKMDCRNHSCTFTKAVHEPLKITQTPTSTTMQATPNLPPQSQVSTERWLKVFAGLIYVVLTVYLFIIAYSNLLKREILFLVVDLSLWAGLTAAMYVVLNGGF